MVLIVFKAGGLSMNDICDSLEKSINNEAWYPALATALTLPDICGAIDQPTVHGRPRYITWFDANLSQLYSSQAGPTMDINDPLHAHLIKAIQQFEPDATMVDGRMTTTLLSGDDCYALRCAYLHSGSDDVGVQPASKVLDRIVFTTPSKVDSTGHRNKAVYDEKHVLQLQIDIFVMDV